MDSLSDLSTLAPYLGDPLILLGFVIFLWFGVHRYLIKSNKLKPLDANHGAQLLRSVLRYGVLIVILVALGIFFLTFQNNQRDNIETETHILQLGNERFSERRTIRRALEDDNDFVRHLALVKLISRNQSTFSGTLFSDNNITPFIITISSYTYADNTFVGKFVGWDETFSGKISGEYLVLIGRTFSFSARLDGSAVMRGEEWSGCITTFKKQETECEKYKSVEIRLI